MRFEKMGRWLLLLCLLTAANASASEFRYRHLETTGLTDRVYDRAGVDTAIVFAKDSNVEFLAILRALSERQVYGTKGIERYLGAHHEQGIILAGEFISKTKRTGGGPNTAVSEPYRDFRLTGVKVKFPLTRFELAPSGNPIDGPMILETHFGFNSLLPAGVLVNGKPVDLGRHFGKTARPR